MARIPDAQGLGEVVARPIRLNETQVPRAAFGQGVGETLERIGGQAVAEERRLASQLEAEAIANRKAADKARALNTLHAAQDDLQAMNDEIAEGVRTGAVDKTLALDEWGTRAKERVAAAVEALPAEYRALGEVELNEKASRWGRGVSKAVTQRDQQDVRSGIDQTLEHAGRLYLKDPKAADQLVNDTLDQLGGFSGLNPAELQKVRQGWKESSRFTLASSLVNSARRDNAALTAIGTRLSGDEFADMDPQRKTQLLTTLEGYQVANTQRAEADARRRQAESERVLRQAESQFTAAQSILSTGKVLSPDYVAQLSKSVAGTPYELALREAMKQGPENAAFGTRPLAEQQRILSESRAKLNAAGTDPKTEKRVAELERIHQQAVKDYADDPLLAAQERGIVQQVAPISVRDVPSLVAGITERVGQAQLVSQQTGAPVSPLLKAEAEQVGKMLTILPVDQRSAAIAQLAAAVGPQQAAALGRQMAPKDKALGLALGMAGSKTSAGRYTSELLLRGDQALRDKQVQKDDKALSGVRAQVVAEIGDAYQNQEQREAMIEAAVLAEYGLRSEGSGDVRRAVNLATGGITERNGRKMPLPYGVTADEFDQRVRAVRAADLVPQLSDGNVYVAGQPVDPNEFVGALPDAVLLHAGRSKYFIAAGGGLASNSRREPIVLEIK